MSDSYVLVLRKNAIARGPDFSQRALATKYGKKHHLRDFVWFQSGEGCFVLADTESVGQVREFEKAQNDLNKRWDRDGSNPTMARELRQKQEQHTVERDELIWKLFDNLKGASRLNDMKVVCSQP